jgi:hypothetical protein
MQTVVHKPEVMRVDDLHKGFILASCPGSRYMLLV